MASKIDDPLREDWDRFIEEAAPHWPILWRYRLKLTRNPFDADDLVSETLIKTFGSRAFTTHNLETPIAFMVRVASRTWIDEQRRRETFADAPLDFEAAAPERQGAGEVGDAARLLYDLSPIQRAVLVLKDVFEMSHDEIARTLSISPENSRTTLHRSRKLVTTPLHRAPRASKDLVQRFVRSFMSGDIDKVKALLLEDVESNAFPRGRELCSKDDLRWLKRALYKDTPTLELRNVLGDQAILVFRTNDKDQEALEEVWLLAESDGRVAGIIGYGVPLLVRWVAGHCNVPARDVRFRYGFDARPTD